MEARPKQPTTKGSAEMFVGDVLMDPIASGEPPARVRVSKVRFAPGARTAWHRHTLGQFLYVTDGAGRAQARGEDLIQFTAGDVLYTPPDQWHWHGAEPDHYMSHLSITEGILEGDRPESEWAALVTDDEYSGE